MGARQGSTLLRGLRPSPCQAAVTWVTGVGTPVTAKINISASPCGASSPGKCAVAWVPPGVVLGLGGGLVPSWDVLGLGVPPGDVLSAGVGVLPGDVLRSGEDVGTPGNPCPDPDGPTHITVAPHTDPATFGHPQAHAPATPLPPLGHSPRGEHGGAVGQGGALHALALGFQLVSLGWQRWQWGSRLAVGRGLIPKGWW